MDDIKRKRDYETEIAELKMQLQAAEAKNTKLQNKIDVLQISAGDIELDGYAYGFIGGCCGFIDKSTLAFSGNISLHRDFADIRDFAGNYHIKLHSLTNGKLYDIGGILPVKEIYE